MDSDNNDATPGCDGIRRKEKKRNRKRTTTTTTAADKGRKTDRNWRQTSLWGGSYGSSDKTIWGDTIGAKQQQTLRLGFQNINTFPASANAPKNAQIHQFLRNKEFDMFGMAEINRHWKNVPTERGIHEQTWRWCEHKHISYAFNTTERPSTEFQVGGTALFSFHKTVSTV